MTPTMRPITDEEVCEMLDWFEDAFGEAAPDDELQHRDNNRIAHAIEIVYDGGLAQWFKDRNPYATWTDHDDYLASQAQDQL